MEPQEPLYYGPCTYRNFTSLTIYVRYMRYTDNKLGLKSFWSLKIGIKVSENVI